MKKKHIRKTPTPAPCFDGCRHLNPTNILNLDDGNSKLEAFPFHISDNPIDITIYDDDGKGQTVILNREQALALAQTILISIQHVDALN